MRSQKWLYLLLLISMLAFLAWVGQNNFAAEIDGFPRAQPLDPKAQFIQFMFLQSQSANASILSDRQHLLELYQEAQNSTRIHLSERDWLVALANRYGLDIAKVETDDEWKMLIDRVNVVPNSLVIAQAIEESAWGTSRFAKEGNNYFGTWCYHSGCGFVPQNRPSGEIYEVARFPDSESAVANYMNNLNSNDAYAQLRAVRTEQLQEGRALTGQALVNTLNGYSTRGDAYVRSIARLIHKYHLEQYDDQRYLSSGA